VRSCPTELNSGEILESASTSWGRAHVEIRSAISSRCDATSRTAVSSH